MAFVPNGVALNGLSQAPSCAPTAELMCPPSRGTRTVHVKKSAPSISFHASEVFGSSFVSATRTIPTFQESFFLIAQATKTAEVVQQEVAAIDRRIQLVKAEKEYYDKKGMDTSRFVEGLALLQEKRAELLGGKPASTSASNNRHDHDHELEPRLRGHPALELQPDTIREMMKQLDNRMDLIQKEIAYAKGKRDAGDMARLENGLSKLQQERADLKSIAKYLDPDCANCADCQAEAAATGAVVTSNGHHKDHDHDHDHTLDPRLAGHPALSLQPDTIREMMKQLDNRADLIQKEIAYAKGNRESGDVARLQGGLDTILQQRADLKAIAKFLDPDCANCAECQAEAAAAS
mmetsp:Transcript_12037/g.20909  ORF Transcript_12037/g.20909 Transcript_12037/m.20909 type:complete len:349 (+) Transcript_12037:73-1119(+)|eukprot:CAMPEP_0196654302 /NCGR_PEP_ID=MMETSP1086-20130531/4014_1 /TAXON_ID=77921 /ORGANISM="Cyanoptyche  gloeocystis , Strain SAG4.97" /LENGTH=348 /DNA_ID=CAMNT_0041985987 /DNA_START=72 /DNA_END=1118 /DNA_ORIENTATION=-